MNHQRAVTRHGGLVASQGHPVRVRAGEAVHLGVPCQTRVEPEGYFSGSGMTQK